jgi:lysophospholipase L1-like esterase
MKRSLFAVPLIFAIVLCAQTTNKQNSAIVPVPRGDWIERHNGFVAIAKNGGVDLLFLGDSITDGWRKGGKTIWDKDFAPLKAANFGISGDQTQHVLWRLKNGELDGIKPKLAVLMIGTNNLRGNSDDEIVDGIKAIINELHTKTPTTKLLLLGIFPRSMKAEDTARARIKQINSVIAKLDDGGKTIKYLDIGDKFLEPDGTLPKDIMPDALHPNAKGYQIWADAVREPILKMLK